MIPRIINTIKTWVEPALPKPEPVKLPEAEKDAVVLDLPFYPDAVAKMLEARIRGKK